MSNLQAANAIFILIHINGKKKQNKNERRWLKTNLIKSRNIFSGSNLLKNCFLHSDVVLISVSNSSHALDFSNLL
jgi:hypothetical protein